MTLARAWIRRVTQIVAVLAGVGILTLGLAVTPATAATVCNPGGDICVVVPDTVQTPLGLVTVTVSATNVATVHLAPNTANVLVFGVPFAIPPGPPGLPGYTRTSVATTAGVINIDSIVVPPGPPGRFALPNLAVISIIPPGPPCRATTSGTTVVFTPIIPPGPPA
ncbi:hypothetical protein [Lapillicoccus sp.]|uniref:hypothetical protein n=1 Tax=Lapillicoccus sp. TaxID=1909287 RepID=UPI0025DF4AB6|nr:hypothetical protein [Lapillicoccus sp.]